MIMDPDLAYNIVLQILLCSFSYTGTCLFWKLLLFLEVPDLGKEGSIEYFKSVNKRIRKDLKIVGPDPTGTVLINEFLKRTDGINLCRSLRNKNLYKYRSELMERYIVDFLNDQLSFGTKKEIYKTCGLKSFVIITGLVDQLSKEIEKGASLEAHFFSKEPRVNNWVKL